MAKEYLEEWLASGTSKLELAVEAKNRGYNKDAAFLLHQATESLYHRVLLVCTFYTLHIHNLVFLRTPAERLEGRPAQTRKERAMFEKLRRLCEGVLFEALSHRR